MLMKIPLQLYITLNEVSDFYSLRQPFRTSQEFGW